MRAGRQVRREWRGPQWRAHHPAARQMRAYSSDRSCQAAERRTATVRQVRQVRQLRVRLLRLRSAADAVAAVAAVASLMSVAVPHC